MNATNLTPNPVDHLRDVLTAMSLDDLRELVDQPGPFVSVLLPSPSAVEDPDGRLAAHWRVARGSLAGRWPEHRLAELDERIAAVGHRDAAALAIVQAQSGAVLIEPLADPVVGTRAQVDPLPRLATVLEDRQRTLPHLVVRTDRAGADVIAFDGGSTLGAEIVEGETEYIHRGHPGGWSQRRYQQRAENLWEQNAGEVAATVLRMAEAVDPVVVAVAGEVRAQDLVADALAPRLGPRVVRLEAGDDHGIADEVVRLVADHVARAQRSAADRLRSGLHDGTATTHVLPALAEGRVATLLLDDDDHDLPVLAQDPLGGPDGTREIDAAIRGALLTDADILVVPALDVMEGSLAALLRWA